MDINTIVSLVGTLIGALGGVITSSRLTGYKIDELSKHVDKHNHFAERMPVVEEQIKVINHRIDDLEKEHN